MHVASIIVAAGAGRRIGGATPKSYLPIAGRPLILRTVDRVFSSQLVAEVVLVVSADEIDRCRHLLEADMALKGRPYVLQAGGATRQQSVRRGLEKIGAATDSEVNDMMFAPPSGG